MAHRAPVVTEQSCILLFSGGRDSTIAAVRLSKEFSNPVLLTVTTSHLEGIELVRRRLKQMKHLLPAEAEWVHAVVPPSSFVEIGRPVESCLPCHRTYVSLAASLASSRGVRNIALGYTGYQSAWLEQSPAAIGRLGSVLAEFGFRLLLPVAGILSKDDAKSILREHGLTDEALEQKCLKQQFNDTDLTPDQIQVEIENWAEELRRSLTSESMGGVKIHSRINIQDFADDHP